MLKQLTLKNVGPAPFMELHFSDRLNLLTGDNGLGKTFLLDAAWWALTRSWPAEVNTKLSSGMMAKPHGEKWERAVIEFSFATNSGPVQGEFHFDHKHQDWNGKYCVPFSGLVFYALANGSMALWDPNRTSLHRPNMVWNGWDPHHRPPAYVFNSEEIWNGLHDSSGKRLCNGLLADWAGWQKEHGATIKALANILSTLAPSADEGMTIGDLSRISLTDVRDIPTLKMPYGQEVPVLYASSAIRRILSLCYLLVWAWQEHSHACKLLGEPMAKRFVFLIDEIEAHLHPKWQRSIIRSLLHMANEVAVLFPGVQVQFIITTHTPLVLASMEPFFDAVQDKWFDIDLLADKDGTFLVQLSEQPFIRRGDASNWLTSKAFDLQSGCSLEAEEALAEASALLSRESVTIAEARGMEEKLRMVLGDTDPFWVRWRFILEKKGLLS
ncbi:AAA family ATPase [Candidatus Magnetaquicoccus inordinatus]|uniref:AAA family ATPase n=1 Tax=Candidatus Magnetaquicoccus inordinatus TaxID=2496818 RepID=UPI00102B73AD|nr:ATP-binding protein [Candidatus Magnetaquicoccus inordinatus]